MWEGNIQTSSTQMTESFTMPMGGHIPLSLWSSFVKNNMILVSHPLYLPNLSLCDFFLSHIEIQVEWAIYPYKCVKNTWVVYIIITNNKYLNLWYICVCSVCKRMWFNAFWNKFAYTFCFSCTDLPLLEHSSGIRFISACNCGRWVDIS